MKIARKYQCLDCGHRWRTVHNTERTPNGAIIDPPCPACLHQAAETPARIAAPRIATNKSRAIDTAWNIAQQDFGLTNMRDNAKEGEAAFIEPPAPSPSNPKAPGFLWGGVSPNPAIIMPGMAEMRAGAAGGAALANAEGRNPMRLLHQSRPKLVPIPVNKGN